MFKYIMLIVLLALPVKAIELTNVQSAADYQEGAVLSLPGYFVQDDGLLIVRVGVRGNPPSSVTFSGVPLDLVDSVEFTDTVKISTEIRSLPVIAGEVGEIRVTWASTGTDQKGLVAATLVDADTLLDTAVSVAAGPNTVRQAILTTYPDTMILTAFTDFGNGIPAILDHTLDGYPTVPEADQFGNGFHEMKFMAGHLIAEEPGYYDPGYENTYLPGYMDHAMITATYVPEPDIEAALLYLGLGFLAFLAITGRN